MVFPLQPRTKSNTSSNNKDKDTTPGAWTIKAVLERIDEIVSNVSTKASQKWNALLTHLEEQQDQSPAIRWITTHFLRKLSLGAPMVVLYVVMCVLLHFLNITIAPGISRWLGVRDVFHPFNPLTYIRFITHIFGHENMTHLRGNMTHILMVGPSAEEIFGSRNLVGIILAVAISSGFGHVWFGPTNTSQIGASGVVFALILLNSLVSAELGEIPISFVMTATLWTSDEIWKLLFANDQIAHSAHLIGAMVGTAAGYYLQSGKTVEMASRATSWNLVLSKVMKAKSS